MPDASYEFSPVELWIQARLRVPPYPQPPEGSPESIQVFHPGRNAQGQLVLPVVSTELFRRVATDAVTTPGLLPVLDTPDPVTARADR